MFLTHRLSPGLLSITCFLFLSSGIFAKSNENVNHPSLLKTYSKKGLVETAKDHQWSINFNKRQKTDTLNIIALRVEFNGGKKDSSTQITGNGLFGIRGGGDKTELNYYNADTVYKYDQLPHDSTYFARQMDAVKKYYDKVSRGKLVLEYSIFPSGFSEKGYAVDSLMRHYSPGGKKKNETYNDYYFRQSSGLLRFIKEALEAAAKDPATSPFANLTYNESDKTIRDERNRKTVFLVFHAGSSSLTDGIANGAVYADSPSDMIDAFIDSDFFKFYRDTLKLSDNGVTIQGKNRLLIDEVMMCSETSNQDGVNWGIQGILVNQIARQLGIPDLYSNTSGNSGIGAFCIMDFSGYSAGNGFIPTYPSAWVRAFMGWDNVKVAPIGANNKYNIKALTTVLNNNNPNDTSILLVPISSNEYYLIENRQRNLSGEKDIFKYDTTEDKKYISIAHYPFNVNVDKNVISTSGKSESNVIQEVLNNDVSLPASGVLVWHVDEKVIREKLQYNMVNTDSSYRGISLVEADGAFDIGVEFVDALSQTVFDYGSPEDVFPHKKEIFEKQITTLVSGFNPFSKPSSRSNDGGHSYLSIEIAPHSANPLTEKMILNRADTLSHITNFSDTAFSVSVEWDYLARSWPKRTAPEQFFEPLLCDFDKSSVGNEFVLLAKSGRLYAWSPDTTIENLYNKRQCVINRINLRGDTVYNADTVHILDSLANPASMPSAINGRILVPSKNNMVYILSSLTAGQLPYRDSIPLPTAPSTNICNYSDSSWAVGTVDGMIYSGSCNSHEISGVKLDSATEVCAIAAIREDGGIVAAQSNGLISICDLQSKSVIKSKKINGLGPYTLITGDLDANDTSCIVVCDSRHGLWALDKNLEILPGWSFEEPNDWPSVYTYTESENTEDRSLYPVNLSSPSLADIDHDGKLDILVGGTNGIYAFNRKGVLIYGWPAYLDTKYWLQRGSVTSSPIVVSGKNHEPLVLFSSNTGERVTYEIDKIVRADRTNGKIWYYNQKGILDSMWDFTPKQIDTLLDQNDSLIMPYTIPGGFVDAISAKAKRPYETIQYKTKDFPYQSHWPLTTGGTLATSPLAGFMDNNKQPDLFAVSSDGWVYRWKLPQSIMTDTLFWPMCGFDIGRTFAYAGKAPSGIITDNEPIRFFS
ncbi:MAG: hypothetical protein Q4F84_02820, partial [Fibrobacter sp.]|nr:hypothetical protein [Fibrobacter sp.]